ncbi:DUF998 domain-containing protein [Streptomyces sp. NPDC020799]|uniref:DUF998 domain-containing protein n=2 Tax=unclassified Streptomyces TaxID=2593676 RepID=UPI0037A7E239
MSRPPAPPAPLGPAAVARPYAGAPSAGGAARAVRAGWPLFVAAVLYNAWVLEFVLPTGLDARHSYVSELFAADQRFHLLFGGIEIVTALLVAAGAAPRVPAARGPVPADRWATGGRWALVAFAASSVADVLLPMSCAPSVNHVCEAVNPWHTGTSALAHAALFASMTLFIVASRTEGGRWPRIRRWAPWVLGTALVTALATVGPLFGRPGWHGVPQRAHLVLVGVWLMLLAMAPRRR